MRMRLEYLSADKPPLNPASDHPILLRDYPASALRLDLIPPWWQLSRAAKYVVDVIN